MNKKPRNFIKILVIVLSITGILCGCGGSSYEGSSEPRANVEPVANADTFEIEEDNSINLVPTILINDTDEDGDDLTPRILIPPANGKILSVNGNLHYTPVGDFNGDDSLVYQISDGYGGVASATISLTVTAVNDAPSVKDDYYDIVEDSSKTIHVLSNDTDIDGDSISLFSVSTVINGSVTFTPGSTSISVRPDLNSTDPISFTYIASDGQGGFTTGNVRLDVTPQNDAPLARDDFRSTTINSPIYVDVLANDSDVDKDLLTITNIMNVNGGNADIVLGGSSILVSPNNDSVRTVSLDYEISDGNLFHTASLNVSIICNTYETLGIEFVCINAGTFSMGSTISETGRQSDEGPVTQVTISKDFYLSKYEITKGDWERIRGVNWPLQSTSREIPSDSHPANEISWNDINQVNGFLDDINLLVGCDTSLFPMNSSRYEPSNIPSGCFRLPTEAEWEYAARAGTTTRYSFDNDNQLSSHGWFSQNSLNVTNPVGQKLENPNGLFDMYGNVREWVYDRYTLRYTGGSLIDPSGASSGSKRSLRGGSYLVGATDLRSARRNNVDPNYRGKTTGFRLLLVR